MILASQVIVKAVEQVRAALDPLDIPVFRRRVRALSETASKAVVITLGGCSGERYGVDGSTDWRVNLRVTAIGRSVDEDDDGTADQIAGDVLELAHNALVANPTLGLSGLDMNNGFVLAEDDEDLDEDLTAMVATYEFQICTQGLTASL